MTWLFHETQILISWNLNINSWNKGYFVYLFEQFHEIKHWSHEIKLLNIESHEVEYQPRNLDFGWLFHEIIICCVFIYPISWDGIDFAKLEAWPFKGQQMDVSNSLPWAVMENEYIIMIVHFLFYIFFCGFHCHNMQLSLLGSFFL